MAVLDVDIVNEALSLIGDDGPAVTGAAPNFDTSTNGKIAAKEYVSAVQAIARQFSWDFTRTVVTLTLSGNAAPFPWAYEYIYPPLCQQLWEIAPPSLADMNNPLPIDNIVGTAIVAASAARVIWCNQANAQAVYNGLPPPAAWDSLFRAVVVRFLASQFAMAGAGKPDTAQGYLEASSALMNVAAMKDR